MLKLQIVIIYMFLETITAPPVENKLNGSRERARRLSQVEVQNATYHGLGPREEARAMCSLRTQEIAATANATITRRIHGVVTSRELNIAIRRLEVIIFGQMQQLWQSLEELRDRLAGGSTHSPDRKTVSLQFHNRPIF